MSNASGSNDVPRSVAALLAGSPEVGCKEQAFAFLTVDPRGFPHVCLLSRAELEADTHEIRAAIASHRTGENLHRDRRATLIAIEEVTAHYLKLRLTRSLDHEGRLAVAFELEDHTADSLDLPLDPIAFVATTDLVALESWDLSMRCLDRIRASKSQN